MATQIDLPPELLEAIVCKLDSAVDMASCALVCRAFVVPSQRQLYRKIMLTFAFLTWRPVPNLERRLALLQRFPHIGTYIRDLSIDIPASAEGQQAMGNLLDCIFRGPGPCIVERLAVDFHGSQWDKLSPVIVNAFSNVFSSSSSVQRCHILRVAALPRDIVLQIAHSVKLLSLIHITGILSPDDTFAQTNDLLVWQHSLLEELMIPAGLTSTAISRSYRFLFDLPHLTRLSTPLSAFRVGLAGTGFSGLLHRLQTLTLDCVALIESLDLPMLPELTCLTLAFVRGTTSTADEQYTLPEYIVSALGGLPTPKLKRLTLRVLVPASFAFDVRTPRPDWCSPPELKICAVHDGQYTAVNIHMIECILGYIDPFAVCDDSPGSHFAHVFDGFMTFMTEALTGAFPGMATEKLSFGKRKAQDRVNYMDHLP
ncbi:Membrane transporter [Mycena indigotica]|uniref:Membrane transporter n=1 Tax=Mycena indigotica TaxID=2126181 RepID=A0A8H6SDW1_9AGAR|nr:Membrane transporter [Mycena indigotica]KAF7296936.1 Membrane transporter [Mycena indigotica]